MDVKKSFILDGRLLLQSLSVEFGPCWLPEPRGWYLPYQLEPVIKPGHLYLIEEREHHAKMGKVKLVKKVIESLDDFELMVFSVSGDQLLYPHQKKYLRDNPHPYSAVLTQLLQRCVEHWLSEFAIWRYQGDELKLHKQPQYSIIPLIAEAINPLLNLDEAVLYQIEEHFRLFKQSLFDFLGKDRWIMHSARMKNGKFIIEKHEDFRVWDWMRRYGSCLE